MANSDLGHKLTDKELAKLERRIAKLYRDAGEELQATIDAYFEQFAKRDEEMKALIGTVQNGKEWTEADYKQWRLNQIGRGERYQAMRDKVAQRATDANAVAVSYTNDATPGIYSLNRNYAAYTIERVTGNTRATLVTPPRPTASISQAATGRPAHITSWMRTAFTSPYRPVTGRGR